MKETFKPFFINSNICLEDSDVLNPSSFFDSIAGNTGNSYITYSLIKTLFGGLVEINHIQNIYKYDFSKQDKDTEIINSECTHVILILQDQIRITESYGYKLPYSEIIQFIKRLNIPIIIAGLGANSFNGYESDFHQKLSPELIQFLKDLSEHTKCIGLRGYFTQEVLSKLNISNTQVIGCPSFYEMGRDRVIHKKEYSNNLKVLLSSHSSINSLNEAYNIVLQDEKAFINAIAYNTIDSSFDLEILKRLNQRKFQVFSNIDSWKKFVSEYDFVAGLRLHGGILPVNSGVCSVIMNPDSRAREMSEFLKIPYHPELINEPNIEKIYSICDYDEMNNQYPKLYDKYIQFLNSNGLEDFNSSSSTDPQYINQPVLDLYNREFDSTLASTILLENTQQLDTICQKLNEVVVKLDKQSLMLNEVVVKLDKQGLMLNEVVVKLDKQGLMLNEVVAKLNKQNLTLVEFLLLFQQKLVNKIKQLMKGKK